MKKFALILLLASESIASEIAQLNSKSATRNNGVEEKIWDIKITLSGNTTEKHDQMLAKADEALKFPNALRWDHTPEEMRALTKQLIESSSKTINDMIANKEPRSFENVI